MKYWKELSIPLIIAGALACFGMDRYFNFWDLFFFLFIAGIFAIGAIRAFDESKKERQNKKELDKITKKYFDK